MAWYRNIYECSECGTEWEDEWSCMCDDECPECGVDHSPAHSEDISAYSEANRNGMIDIYYSPREAEHSPDYELLATVRFRSLAGIIEQLAFDIAKPA